MATARAGRPRYTRVVPIAARAARGTLSPDLFDVTADTIAAHLEDAAHYPGGQADAVARPRTEADVAAVLTDGRPVLPVGATVGGAIATNAAGAATYKYGPTRPWVLGLTVVLPAGDVIDVMRGEHLLDHTGTFVIDGPGGHRVVPVPTYVMPDVVKRSAGYHAAPGMDVVDLFVGAEGTLGVITSAVLRVQPARAGLCYALVPVADEPRGLAAP